MPALEASQLDFFRCTACTSAAPLALATKDGREALACPACKREFSRLHDVFLLISKERDKDTLEKFEHQWKTWGGDDVVFGESVDGHEKRFFLACPSTKFDKPWFAGKRVLEAGCGHGIMVQVFDRLKANVVGLDLGDGVFRAAKRIGNPGVVMVQGDILDLPFQPQSFDFVHCCGVLHHTRDTRLAFKKLAATVRKGGGLYVWLYPKKGWVWETTMAVARAFTTRLPAWLLSKLSYLLVPLLYVVPAFSGTSPRKNTIRQCAQVIYDWLSPKYQTHHTFEEVKRWFEEEGFGDVHESAHYPLSVTGERR